MQDWQWHSPTRIFFARRAVQNNARELLLGNKAYIVTGQGGSARRNGALQDVCRALSGAGVAWSIFDRVLSNPDIQSMREAAREAKMEGADFIVGVGGGSPLDAAKAIAVLAVNDLSDEELFNARFSQALPVAAVPTTAGTGSEVTPYSILTYPAIQSKKSIFSPSIIPAVALLDPDYTESLPDEVTVDTAVDSFSHAFESYLTVRTSPISDTLARKVLHIMGRQLHKMGQEGWQPDKGDREQLLYASMLAGMVISQTGTSIPHALGYSFTYFKEVPHGRATGYILSSFARFIARQRQPRLWQALEVAGFKNMENFTTLMKKLIGPAPHLNDKEKNEFLEICSRAKNLNNSIARPSIQDLQQIISEL